MRRAMNISHYSRCEFEVLMSCMNETGFEKAEKSHICSDLLIINQTDKNDYQEIRTEDYLWRMISTTERGLAKSRNMALRNARGKICQLADDDQVFFEGYEKAITEAFKKQPKATVIAFNLERKNNQLKKRYYRIKRSKESFRRRCFGSPMIAIKVDDLKLNNIWFDERFGSGSEWGGGEDTLLQIQIREKGLRIFENPAVISSLDYEKGSQWFRGFDERYFYNIGAFSQYVDRNFISRELYYLYLSFIKLRNDCVLSPHDRIKWLHLGEKGWRENVSYKCYLERQNKD